LQTVSNTPSGLNKLVQWLEKQVKKQGVATAEIQTAEIQVVMEATNVYWKRCAYHFAALGYTVSVVNPAQIKFFAKSTLRRGKTDAMDAEIIARFGLMMRPKSWTPPSALLVEIKQLVREREAIPKQLVRERNHLKALQQGQHTSQLAVRLIRQRMRLLERQTQSLEEAIRQTFAQDCQLQAQLDC